MNFLIVTDFPARASLWLSTHWRTSAFFCIDNIPVALLPRIVDFALQGEKPAQPCGGRHGCARRAQH